MKITHKDYKENPNLVAQIISRYGSYRNIERVSKDQYYIYGDSQYMRTGEGFIDFEGGPIIVLGTSLKDISLKLPDKIVTGIMTYKEGYKLTTKRKENG